MKKLVSLLLAGSLVLSTIPTAFAVDYTAGTQVSYNSNADNDGDGYPDSTEAYSITVPAKLAPGDTGYVVAEGTWASNRKLIVNIASNPVTGRQSVTLTNDIDSSNTKELDIAFEGISLFGSNTTAVTNVDATNAPYGTPVSVADIENALFGTWSGIFNYNAEIFNKYPFLEGTLYYSPGGSSVGYRFFPKDDTWGWAVYYMDYTRGIDDRSGSKGSGYVDYVVRDGKYIFEGNEWIFSADGVKFTISKNSDVMFRAYKESGTTTIPAGGTYTTPDGTTYSAGEQFPKVSVGDIYTEGDYEYRYGYLYSGYDWNKDDSGRTLWSVICTSNISNPGVIPEEINGQPVTSMSYTFKDCTNLTVVSNIPETVTNMDSTFYGCTQLVHAPEIPDSVTGMSSTFANCTALTTPPVLPPRATWLWSTFENCTSLTEAPAIPETVSGMPRTFIGCTNLTIVPEIPDSVTNMQNTFSGCTSLTVAPELPASVTNLYGTFSDCTNLTTAPEIPDSVTDMSDTFYRCTNLTVAPKIPDSVTRLYSTFSGCTNLNTAPEIPSGVTNMSNTFADCTSLTGEISIPCSLARKNYAYRNCPATITYYHVDGCDGSCGL